VIAIGQGITNGRVRITIMLDLVREGIVCMLLIVGIVLVECSLVLVWWGSELI
jgi:hypothetical protein